MMIHEICRSVYYGVEPGWECPSPNADRHTRLDWVIVLRCGGVIWRWI